MRFQLSSFSTRLKAIAESEMASSCAHTNSFQRGSLRDTKLSLDSLWSLYQHFNGNFINFVHLAIVEPVGKIISSTSFAVMIGNCFFFTLCIWKERESILLRNYFWVKILEKKNIKFCTNCALLALRYFKTSFCFHFFFQINGRIFYSTDWVIGRNHIKWAKYLRKVKHTFREFNAEFTIRNGNEVAETTAETQFFSSSLLSFYTQSTLALIYIDFLARDPSFFHS